MNQATRRVIVTGLSLCGFFLMLWSAQETFNLLRGDRITGSICTINAYWNCDRASLSALGIWFSIPVGIFGALWFLMAGFLGLSVRTKLLRPWLIFGFLMVGLMSSYLIFKLKAGCLTCYASYLLILTLGFMAWKPLDGFKSLKLLNILVTIGILFVGVFAVWNLSRQNDRISESEFQKWFQYEESVPLLSPFHVGSESAPITVVEFSDFGCPHCARATEVVLPFLKSQKDVKFYFYPFPLDSACNSEIKRSVHPFSCDWARRVICAQAQDKEWAMHDQIFEYVNRELSLPDPQVWKPTVDLDAARFQACLESQNTEHMLQSLIDVGKTMRISSTPTFFVNGRRFEGLLPIPLAERLFKEFRAKR